MKKPVTFAILKEKTPSTPEDLKTKLKPGVYMGFFGDERQETLELIHSLEDDDQYARDHAWLNNEIEKEFPGKGLEPMTKEARMARAKELRAEVGLGVDEGFEIGEPNDLG